jgi:2-hydroxychromene-2-carboxylate isomerase
MDAAFYFDLSSPLAYLVAERILHELPGPVEWQPVNARELEPTSPATGSPQAPAAQPRPTTDSATFRAEIECRARALGL